MGESKTTNGIFMGKILSGTCTKKDGTKSNEYKLTFKPSEVSEKTFTFSEFVPLDAAGKETASKFDLKMSEWYNIKFYETQGSYQGKAITYKNLVDATPGKGDVTPMNQGDTTTQTALPTKEIESLFNDAMKEYLANVGDKADMRVATRMLGACLLRAYPVLYKSRYEQCVAVLQK